MDSNPTDPRLRELCDRTEITDVVHRYTRAVDADDRWDLLDTVFTPDAEIDYTATGGIADRFPVVKAWLAEVLPAFFPRRMHSLHQVMVELAPDGDCDTARVTAYFHNPMPVGEGPEAKVVEYGGVYHHDMVRTPDGWRSRRLVEELVWRRESRAAL